MPLVHPTDVVSFSSEDPYHPASNLLNRETFRKWKCSKEAIGNKDAFVILKFEKAITITNIDIGNDGSALVEVSVGRSGGSGEPQFEVILCSTVFMSPADSREGKNLNGVKSFSLHSLSKPVASQKWDLVKVLVSQPFNRHVQFGLTFIKFVAAPDPNEPKKIGIFGIRKPIAGSDDEEDIKPGSLFTASRSPEKAGPLTLFKPKPSSNSISSTNAAIREVTNKLDVASKSSSESDVKDLLQKPKKDFPLASTSSPNSGSKSKASSDSSSLLSRKQLEDKPKNKEKDKNSQKASPASTSSNKSAKKRALSPDGNSSNRSNGSSTPSTSKGLSPAKKKTKRKTKPFDQLLEGVVFSMSGFENPLRGQLRDRALQMGARYKADWDSSCTHLICAFYNTPKFRQVRSSGNGKIVKKEWIQECYSSRRFIPWRRFCLDRNDKGNESEEEVYADDGNENDNDGSDTTEIEENDVNKNKRKRVMIMDSSDESDDNGNQTDESKNAYEADTDVDEDKTPDLSPSLIDSNSGATPCFENTSFYIEANDNGDQAGIKEIIMKHKGLVHERLSEDSDYYICNNLNWNEKYTDALSDNPNLTFIHKNWILECDKEDALIDKTSFILLPT